MKIKYIAIGLLLLGAGYATAFFIRQGQLLSDTEMEYVGYKVNELSLNRARVTISIRIINKSDWDFTVSYQKYEAFLNGFKVADITSAMPVKVYKRSSAIANLLIDFSPKETIKTGLTQLVANLGNAQISLTGYFSASTGIVVVNRVKVNETWTLKNFKSTQ